MEMKKMKMSSEHRDRLSELPDSLILNIFEFLPMKNVVSTQILSHRWKNLWTLTPYLNFDNKFDNFEKFRNFVNRCLICWRGKKIQKFKVRSHTFDKSLFSDMDLWVRFAVDNGVQELETFFSTVCFKDRDDYCVPKCLYSCPSLRKLSFFGNTKEISGKLLQLNQLKRLNIVCYSVTQHAIEQIMSGIPSLEVFFLSFQDRDVNLILSFRSSSLKELWVRKRSFSKDSPDRMFDHIPWDTELRIWTPNLEILRIYGVLYGKCSVMNVPSKTHVTLSFDMNVQLCRTLYHVLPTIRHVEELTLSDSCTKVLLAMTRIVTLPPLKGVIFLKLNGSFGELRQMVRLLEFFPELKTLVLQEESKNVDRESKTKKFKPNPSKSFMVELKTIKVTWTMRDFSIFPLIKVLLKYASKLEKMVFQVKRNVPASDSSNSMFLASQKLLKMPRSSPTAKLILCEY